MLKIHVDALLKIFVEFTNTKNLGLQLKKIWRKFPVANKMITVKMGIIHYYKSTSRPKLSQLPFFML